MFRDKIDEKIIDFLKNDSRESFVDIGKKLKLSESAVRRRVKNLNTPLTIKEKKARKSAQDLLREKKQDLENLKSTVANTAIEF